MQNNKKDYLTIIEKSAQGTIEYLIIIAIIVVIALVIVSLLINQTSSATTVNEQQSKLYWASQPLAITDSQTDANGTLLLVIKNNTSEMTTIQSITINGTAIYPDNLTLQGQETKTIHLNKPQLGATINNTITITYQTQNGLTKNQTGATNLTTTQITTINPTNNTLLLNQTNCFDWNSSLNQHPICTCNDLNTIDYNATTRSWAYILQNNIDFRNCDPSYTTGTGWDPIGSPSVYFTGNFNGNNKTIASLYINNPDNNYHGLFAHLNNVDINNLGLINVNINGSYNIGGVAGYAYNNSIIHNSYSTGTINGYGSRTGGIAGYLNTNSIISNSYSLATVNGMDYTGGLVGLTNNGSSIYDSYFNGTITGGAYTGGLVGYFVGYGQINNSYFSGLVNGEDRTGGLAGHTSSSKINNSYSIGTVRGTSYVGGITGWLLSSSRIINTFSVGEITNTGNYTGGLAGAHSTNSIIDNSYSTGRVMGATYVSGGVGYIESNSMIRNSFSTGTIIGTSSARGIAGGGGNYSISNVYWYDSNSSDTAITCYMSGDANCTKLADTNYTLLYDSATNLYDGNLPYWNDGNWVWNGTTYPRLRWQR